MHVNSHSIDPLPPNSHGVTVIFRDCTLCPRVAIRRGVTSNLGLQGLPINSVRGQIRSTSDLLKLSGLLSHGPTGLSKNRQRQITLTHTLIHRPSIFLLSRPLDGLSTLLHRRIQTSLGRLFNSRGSPIICIARSRARTVALSAGITILGSNCLRRLNDPTSVCGHPTGHFITKFVNDPRVGLLDYSHTNRRILLNSAHVPTPIPLPSRKSIIINLHPRSIHLPHPRSGIAIHNSIFLMRGLNVTGLVDLQLRNSGPLALHSLLPTSTA